MERQPIAVRSVKEIQGSEKRWLEAVLGQHLHDNQQVFIMLFTPGVVPDEATRRRARDGIRNLQAKAQAHADAQGITNAEIDAAVDEAMDHVRPPAD